MNTSVLCLHGALGAASSFKKIKDAVDGSLDLHIIEFSGHGKNDKPYESLDTKLFANDVIEWIKTSGQEKVTIFGHSMGGYIGLYLAAQHPELVSRVFTFGTKMDWTPEFAASESALLNPSYIKEKNTKLQAYLESTHNNWEKLSGAVGTYMNGLAENSMTPSELGSISCPIRFSVGDRDHMVSTDETYRSYKATPGSQFQVFPGTYHAVERLNPKYFLESMVDFLQV